MYGVSWREGCGWSDPIQIDVQHDVMAGVPDIGNNGVHKHVRGIKVMSSSL